MEKTKKSKKFRKKIGYLAVLAISFGLVVFMSVGATLAWFAGSDWADNTMYMGGPVYISMYGEDNSGRKITSGFGNLEVSAATDSRTTGITSLTDDEKNDMKVLLPGQRMEIHAVARLRSSAYETSYREKTTGGIQEGTQGELNRSTNALLRARFALNVEFDSDIDVGDKGFYKLPTYNVNSLAEITDLGKYKFYVSSADDTIDKYVTPEDISEAGVHTKINLETLTLKTEDPNGDGKDTYYYEIPIGDKTIITPDGTRWTLSEKGKVTTGVGASGGTAYAWSYLSSYSTAGNPIYITPYANEQDLVNELNSKLMSLIVESNAIGFEKTAKWGWRYIPAEVQAGSTDSQIITMPNGDTFAVGFDRNGMESTDVSGWWYLVDLTGEGATNPDVATDNDFTKLNTNANAKMFEIDTRNFKTGNSYDGNAGATNEIPFIDGEFALPGDQLSNMYANAKIDFKITFQAIQAFLPWQSDQESNYKISADKADSVEFAVATDKLGVGKDLSIGNACIIFDEAFNNEAYKATNKPKNSQATYI
mgnify:CR=1 FL=1